MECPVCVCALYKMICLSRLVLHPTNRKWANCILILNWIRGATHSLKVGLQPTFAATNSCDVPDDWLIMAYKAPVITIILASLKWWKQITSVFSCYNLNPCGKTIFSGRLLLHLFHFFVSASGSS